MLKEKISRFFYYPLLERESVIVVGESFIYVGSYFRLNHESLKRVQSRTKFIEIHIGIPFSLEDKLKLIRFISERRLSILTSNVKIRKFYIPDLFSNNFPIANYPFSIQLLRNKSSVIKTFLRLFPRRGDQFLSAYFYNIHSSSLSSSPTIRIRNDESSLKNEASRNKITTFSIYFRKILSFFFYNASRFVLGFPLSRVEHPRRALCERWWARHR